MLNFVNFTLHFFTQHLQKKNRGKSQNVPSFLRVKNSEAPQASFCGTNSIPIEVTETKRVSLTSRYPARDFFADRESRNGRALLFIHVTQSIYPPLEKADERGQSWSVDFTVSTVRTSDPCWIFRATTRIDTLRAKRVENAALCNFRAFSFSSCIRFHRFTDTIPIYGPFA